MNDDDRDSAWPEEAGKPRDLADGMTPPSELEDRVTGELLRRELIVAGSSSFSTGPRSAITRGALAAAASLLLVAIGFAIGRLPFGDGTREKPAGPPGGFAASSKYALLLYETEGYRPAVGAEALDRYREYGRWVAEARRRGQFVTGEDLDVTDGRMLSPGEGRPTAEQGLRVGSEAALSGVFLITARDYAHAVALAESLPHLRHGGHVVVQEVIPTEEPPMIDRQVG